MTCRVCGKPAQTLFSARVLNAYDVEYFRCPACGYACTQEPTWLDEAYAQPLTCEDSGILVRNLHFAKVVSCLLYTSFDRNGRFLDYAGGYGIFTRLMRDIGFDYYWHDKYAPNLMARGFAMTPGSTFEAVTAIEVAEHFVDPLEGFSEIFQLSDNVIVTTLLIPDPAPAHAAWWYYGAEHGQHVSFYTLPSLALIARRHGRTLVSNGVDFHVMTRKPMAPSSFRLVHWFAGRGLAQFVQRKMRSRAMADSAVASTTPGPTRSGRTPS